MRTKALLLALLSACAVLQFVSWRRWPPLLSDPKEDLSGRGTYVKLKSKFKSKIKSKIK